MVGFSESKVAAVWGPTAIPFYRNSFFQAVIVGGEDRGYTAGQRVHLAVQQITDPDDDASVLGEAFEVGTITEVYPKCSLITVTILRYGMRPSVGHPARVVLRDPEGEATQ